MNMSKNAKIKRLEEYTIELSKRIESLSSILYPLIDRLGYKATYRCEGYTLEEKEKK